MGTLTGQTYDSRLLTEVFGDTSVGETPEERARTSSREFVRSQVQLAVATEQATGMRLTASEALHMFGWKLLLQVADEGSAILVTDHNEPAATLKARRQALGLSIRQVANRSGVEENVVWNAETTGMVSPIRNLGRLAQVLALDEQVLGFVSGAGADRALGVRLRQLAEATDTTQFSPQAVLGLAEAAWVVSRQASLASLRCIKPLSIVEDTSGRDSNYSFPTWEQGYRLAQQTRETLELEVDEPIKSLRFLAEEVLRIPLVQQELDQRYAGATISNGPTRGIVVNVRGMNENVWVRRMTLCHELGHLLWDPDQRLNKLKVDEYDEFEQGYTDNTRDPVEIRANAFAIAFLAPPEGVRQIASASNDPLTTMKQVMETFGIGATAARHHINNLTQNDLSFIPNRDLPRPSDEWRAAEDYTIDYFPIPSTPISRRGQFAWLVASALDDGQISADTAAELLRCSPEEVTRQKSNILDLLTPITYRQGNTDA